ncbi:MAG: hypothetical protein LBQ87_05495 [Candidatus Fibromonas sp.]|jgi:hypothetical protein|nr:hypothetical protein [Candidatus Fibromonas sp.]
MPVISEVMLIDVSKIMPERAKKYCVCISSDNNKYFVINSNHREMYDDFEIEASNYSFLSHDSYVCCHKTYILSEEFIVSKLGNINHGDMMKILDKIQNSRRIAEEERDTIALELKAWLNNYQDNKETHRA